MAQLRALQRRVSSLLDEFLYEMTENAPPGTARRLAAVRVHLDDFLDRYGWAVLEDRAGFLTERARDPVGAFGRVGHAEDLYYAFRGYLLPRFRMPELADARCQVRLVREMSQWLWARGLLPRLDDSSCVVMDVEASLREARRDVAPRRRH
jgi:hypothetical protein